MGLNFQERAELNRKQKELEQAKKKKQRLQEEEEKRKAKLQAMLDHYNFDEEQEGQQEEQEEQDSNNQRKNDEPDEESEDELDDDENQDSDESNEEDNSDDDENQDSDESNEEDNSDDNEKSDESKNNEDNAENKGENNNSDNPQNESKDYGQRETGGDPAKQGSNNPNSQTPNQDIPQQMPDSINNSSVPNTPTSPQTSTTPPPTTPTATPPAGVASSAGSAGGATGGAAAGATGTGATGGAAAGAAGTGASAGPVLLVILIVILVIILVAVIAYLITSDTFSQKENFSYEKNDTIQFDLEETTVSQIIASREEEFNKPLLRFSTENSKFLFFFVKANSEYRDLIYENLSKKAGQSPYDDIIDELKKQVRGEIGGKDSLLYKRGDDGKLQGRFTVDDPDELIRTYGVSGFSIKNYLLYLENDEFTNSFLADTLTSRDIEEVYETVVNSEDATDADRGDTQLVSITEEFRDYLVYTKGSAIYSAVDSKEMKDLANEFNQEYNEFLSTDLTFSLIYKYLFCSTDNFNSIIWSVYKGNHNDGTVGIDEANSALERFSGTSSEDTSHEGQKDSIYVPKVVTIDLNTGKKDEATYEKNINTIVAMTNPYLMHWVVPYSANTATSDYTFALDVMYNMKCPIVMDLYEVESMTSNTHAHLYINVHIQQYELLVLCGHCNRFMYYDTFFDAHLPVLYENGIFPQYSIVIDNGTFGSTQDVWNIYKQYGMCNYNTITEKSTYEYKPGGPHSKYNGGNIIEFYEQASAGYITEQTNTGTDYKMDKNAQHGYTYTETKNITLVPKIRYAEGMFKIKKEECALQPYILGQPTERTETINDEIGTIDRTELYQDQFGLVEGGETYEKTYKLSYLDEDEYDDDGARASGDKINRIEWFLDYGSGEHDMFPDKKSEDWYANYSLVAGANVASDEVDWETFRNFYHVSYAEINKVAEKNGFEVISNEDSPDNFCKFIEYKYKKNIDALRAKMRELQNKGGDNTDLGVLKYINEHKDEYGFTFEFDVMTEENYKDAKFSAFVDEILSGAKDILVNAWNWFIGKETETSTEENNESTNFYSDNPLIDACFKVNTVQGYDYNNLDFALVEIEKYYDELPVYTSDILSGSVQNMMISMLPPGGLGWPVKEVKGTENTILEDYNANNHKAIDIDAGYEEGKEYGSPALAVFDGTVVGVCGMDKSKGISGKILIQSENGCYIAVYEGMYSINVSEGQKVTKGQELGLIGTPLSDVNKNCYSKVPVYLHFRVAYDISGTFSEVAGDSIAERLWFTLIRAGISENAAAGVLGNIQNESGFVLNKEETGYPYEGRGLCQWSYSRREGLFDYANSLGLPWATESVQFEFLMTELGLSQAAKPHAEYALSGHKNGTKVSDWTNAQSPEDAAVAFCWVFEKPAEATAHLDSRKNDARNYYNKFHGKQQSTEETKAEGLMNPDGTYNIPESMFVDPTVFFNIQDGEFTGTSVTADNGTYSSHTSKVTDRSFSLYSQSGAYYSDWAWSYGSGTISAIGCPLTATANALAAVGCVVDPGTIFKNSNNAGSNPATLKIDLYGASYSGPYGSISATDIVTNLSAGKAIVIRVGTWTSSGHWMALVDYDSSTNTVYLATGKCNGHAGITNLQGNTGDGWYSVSDIASVISDSVYIISK